MATQLHWVQGPWRGKLALAARPRGEDWLEDELAGWRRGGVDTVVSLLEPNEARELGLGAEAGSVEAHGMRFRSIPVPDRQVPESRLDFGREVEALDRELASGRNVVVHCRQGIGRTGLLAACLFAGRNIAPDEAVRTLSEARGIVVPETAEQLRWLEQYAGLVVVSA